MFLRTNYDIHIVSHIQFLSSVNGNNTLSFIKRHLWGEPLDLIIVHCTVVVWIISENSIHIDDWHLRTSLNFVAAFKPLKFETRHAVKDLKTHISDIDRFTIDHRWDYDELFRDGVICLHANQTFILIYKYTFVL